MPFGEIALMLGIELDIIKKRNPYSEFSGNEIIMRINFSLKNKYCSVVLSAFLAALALTGCGEAEEPASSAGMNLPAEASALGQSPAAIGTVLTPEAPGTQEARNEYAVIDYSNTADGYIMVQYTADTQQRLKAQVVGPTTTYTYNLTQGQWAALPLSDGNGAYQITVYENVEGNKYAAVLSASFSAQMEDEFAPFLRPNQYVDYEHAPNTVTKAAQLTAGCTDTLDKVAKVYDFVIANISYDKKLAESVTTGYLPELDAVLEKGKGICFDYAALMTGMLRSQSVPCKLVVGYAGEAYHAWINVWVDGTGWVDGVIFFDGTSWQIMDPTFASNAGSKSAIAKYIGDGENYSAKYFY